MNGLALVLESRDALYSRLMAGRRGHPVEETLALMLVSWSQGHSTLHGWLGLTENQYREMMANHFPEFDSFGLAAKADIVDPQRFDELDDLRKLLVINRTGDNDTELLMAEIVIAGCMGSDHLWQDLGLWQRTDLSRLMLENFQPLALRNNMDMKWKKFLYKQLCETEGIYTCRSPSCDVCADFYVCFGPEE